MSADGLTALTAAPFTGHLRELVIRSPVNDSGLIALSAGQKFTELTQLELSCGRVTRVGIESLAIAEFVPRLRELRLHIYGDTLDAGVLRPLAEALDPTVLNHLRVSGLDEDVPEFFVERFGERVEFG